MPTIAIQLTIENLLTSLGIRDFERMQLQSAHTALQQGQRAKTVFAKLEAALRPLALRDNLTPDVADLYDLLQGQTPARFDLSIFHAADGLHQARAIFAGGCFWCMVKPFDELPGIQAVVSGYTGGRTAQPTTAGMQVDPAGHVEAVEIIYDSRQISYAQLLAIYWQLIDPLDGNGQFQDRGLRYRPVIFWLDDQQRRQAEQSVVEASARLGQAVAVKVAAATTFWPAENRQQAFYKHQPKRYRAVMQARRRLLRWQKLKHWLKQINH